MRNRKSWKRRSTGKKMLLPCGFRRPILQPQFPQTLHFLPTACIGRQAFTYDTYKQLTVNILPGYLALMIIVIQSSWIVHFLLINLSLSLSFSVAPTRELIAQNKHQKYGRVGGWGWGWRSKRATKCVR